jgi:transcriptional regulator with XRE-family HTH domain
VPGRDKFSPQYQLLVANLVAARIKRNLSQQQVAALLGVQQPMLSKIESCQQQLGLLDFIRYCKAVSLDPRAGIQFLAEADKKS